MNHIVNTTSVFPPCRDAEEVLVTMARVGYDALDMAFDYCVQEKDFPFMTERYEFWADSLRSKAESLGVPYTHSHAPFDAAARGDIVERSLRCASLLGVRYMVVHPILEGKNGIITDEEEFILTNAEAVRPLLAMAEKHGIVLLSENLLYGASTHAETIARLVEEVNSPGFGWCYDTGHAHVTGDTAEALRRVKTPPLSLHIQDNHGDRGDEHLMPGDGSIDWAELFRSLKEVGYCGELVLETHRQPLDAAEEEREGILCEILSRAKRLRGYYNRL